MKSERTLEIFSTIFVLPSADVTESHRTRPKRSVTAVPMIPTGRASQSDPRSPACDEPAPLSDTDEIRRFETLKTGARRALDQFHPVVKAIILSDYCRDEYHPPQGLESELEMAVRRCILVEGDDGYAVCHENKDVKNAKASLEGLDAFLRGKTSPTFIGDYERNYNSEADIRSQSFWEEHFHFHVPE
jgi:hypothetical protein